MKDNTVYESMMKKASLYDLVNANPMFHPYEMAGNAWKALKSFNPVGQAKDVLSEAGSALKGLKDSMPKPLEDKNGIVSDLKSSVINAPANTLHNMWYADEILTGKRKPKLTKIDQRILDALKRLFGVNSPSPVPQAKTASVIKLAAGMAGFSMPKGIGDALKPAPAPMKINPPKQQIGDKMMNQAAAAEGVSAPAATTDPVSALTASLDKITAVAKGSLPQAQNPAASPTPAAPVQPNPAQVAQQPNQTEPQPGPLEPVMPLPKSAAYFNKTAKLLTTLNGIRKVAAHDFFNYGAGSRANEIMDMGRKQLDAMNASVAALPWVTDKQKRNLREQSDQTIQNVIKGLKPYINSANLDSAALGGGAGIAGTGLAYAGLGLIPGLEKRRGLRLLTALMLGVPAGAYVGHKVGRNSFENQLMKDVNLVTGNKRIG